MFSLKIVRLSYLLGQARTVLIQSPSHRNFHRCWQQYTGRQIETTASIPVQFKPYTSAHNNQPQHNQHPNPVSHTKPKKRKETTGQYTGTSSSQSLLIRSSTMWTNDRGLLSVDLSSSINQLLELYSQCDRIAVLLPSLNEFQRCECNSSASPSCPPHLDPLTLLARSVKLTTLRRRRIHRTSIHSHSLPGLCRRQCTILRLFLRSLNHALFIHLLGRQRLRTNSPVTSVAPTRD